MEKLIAFFNSLFPAGLDWAQLLKTGLILGLGFMLLGLLSRLLFGKSSVLNHSLSSAISILFIYIVTVLIHAFGVDLLFLISPLPYVEISGDYLRFIVSKEALSSQLISMTILSFLANLTDSWLPKGKGLFGWFFFRCISVLLAMLLHLIVVSMLHVILPVIVLLWAPRILLWALILMIVLGACKVLFAATSPVFEVLHKFFFKDPIGKMIYRSVLTTALLTLIVYILNYFGVGAFYIASSALGAYAPMLVVLLIIWYVIGHLL